jgi:hypothetical protein
MSASFTKQEYVSPLDGSTTANNALLKATLAFDRIERHEDECSQRWSVAIKLLLLVLGELGALLLFLLSDKLGWFL